MIKHLRLLVCLLVVVGCAREHKVRHDVLLIEGGCRIDCEYCIGLYALCPENLVTRKGESRRSSTPTVDVEIEVDR